MSSPYWTTRRKDPGWFTSKTFPQSLCMSIIETMKPRWSIILGKSEQNCKWGKVQVTIYMQWKKILASSSFFFPCTFVKQNLGIFPNSWQFKVSPNYFSPDNYDLQKTLKINLLRVFFTNKCGTNKSLQLCILHLTWCLKIIVIILLTVLLH